ncbi:hypothetical protein MTR67_042648 [Solanum verrucosum]|uniref:Cyanobacterial aminoacyl-tRNA synthetase CAAD domain-containing protein n=1 Tax=Solanum verrucosum TaxID=315347 RepID=A0AAF0ZTK8_SOLVR|nr:hypothetical protein MTR67_042648 [Solanum verrucosum]
MAAIAAASTSMASSAVFTTHLSLCYTAKAASFCRSALPYLPPRVSASAFSTSFKFAESKRSSLLQVKASSSEEASVDTSEFITELKEKWDAVEDKTTVLLYGGGAIVAVWLSSILVGAINSVPLTEILSLIDLSCDFAQPSESLIFLPFLQLPKVLELVGLGYTGWFVYRYLLFKVRSRD